MLDSHPCGGNRETPLRALFPGGIPLRPRCHGLDSALWIGQQSQGAGPQGWQGEANAAGFTPDKGEPCAEGAAIFRFSWQADWAKTKGFRPSQVLMGVPGWQYEWGGSALPRHLKDLAKIGAGCAVWDIPSTLGNDKDARWGSEEAWKALTAFKQATSSR